MTAVPAQPAYYLISTRPAASATGFTAPPAILDNDGWLPARD